MTGVLVCLFAAVGAVCRYAADVAIQRRHRTPFPVGTVVINLSGSLLLGVVTGLSLHHGLHPAVTAVAGVGFCGGFTTFSAWMWETVALLEARSTRGAGNLAAAVNIVGSALLGLAAAAAGLALAQL